MLSFPFSEAEPQRSLCIAPLFFAMMDNNVAGMPLESYNRSTPPGWRPGVTKFTIRRYLERLRLWYRQTDLGPEQVGPAVAGRLAGRAFDTAMSLRIVTQSGRALSGDSALAFAGEAAQTDQAGNVVLPAVDSGLQQLLRILQQQYGADEQQIVTGIIDNFTDLRRGRLTLLEFLNEFSATYEDANRLGGFELNAVGKSHFLLKYSGLDEKMKDHFLLLVGYDLRKF